MQYTHLLISMVCVCVCVGRYGTAFPGFSGPLIYVTEAECGSDGQFSIVTCVGLPCEDTVVVNSDRADTNAALSLVVGETAMVSCDSGQIELV